MIRALVMRGPHRFGRAVSYSTQGDNMSFLLLVNFWRYRGRGERNQSEPVSQFQRPQLRPLGPTAFGLLERYRLWRQEEAAYFVATKKQREKGAGLLLAPLRECPLTNYLQLGSSRFPHLPIAPAAGN